MTELYKVSSDSSLRVGFPPSFIIISLYSSSDSRALLQKRVEKSSCPSQIQLQISPHRRPFKRPSIEPWRLTAKFGPFNLLVLEYALPFQDG